MPRKTDPSAGSSSDAGIKHLAVYRLDDRTMVACYTPQHSLEASISGTIDTVLKANAQGMSYKDYFQAGKSVDEIDKVETTAEIMERFRAAHGGP